MRVIVKIRSLYPFCLLYIFCCELLVFKLIFYNRERVKFYILYWDIIK